MISSIQSFSKFNLKSLPPPVVRISLFIWPMKWEVQFHYFILIQILFPLLIANVKDFVHHQHNPTCKAYFFLLSIFFLICLSPLSNFVPFFPPSLLAAVLFPSSHLQWVKDRLGSEIMTRKLFIFLKLIFKTYHL